MRLSNHDHQPDGCSCETYIQNFEVHQTEGFVRKPCILRESTGTKKSHQDLGTSVPGRTVVFRKNFMEHVTLLCFQEKASRRGRRGGWHRAPKAQEAALSVGSLERAQPLHRDRKGTIRLNLNRRDDGGRKEDEKQSDVE